MDINLIVNLCSKAWGLSILANIHAGVPGRQAALLQATGAGRSAFGASVNHLIRIGLLRRRDGHGHPLRPEFELTDHGRYVATFAEMVWAQVRAEEQPLLRKAWSLPVIAVLAQEDSYGAVRRTLSPITDRALSQSLRGLERAKWVERRVDIAARPPKPSYLTIGTGVVLAEISLRFNEAT